MRQHTTESNGGSDQSVEFLVTTNGELQVPGCDALYLEVLSSVAGKLEDLGGEVFENSGDVNSS